MLSFLTKMSSKNKDKEPKPSITDPAESFAQIVACISSGDGYRQNSPIVLQTLAQQSEAYTDSFLGTLFMILSSGEYSPTLKFYALYLLTKATEQKNEFLADRLARE